MFVHAAFWDAGIGTLPISIIIIITEMPLSVYNHIDTRWPPGCSARGRYQLLYYLHWLTELRISFCNHNNETFKFSESTDERMDRDLGKAWLALIITMAHIAFQVSQ